MLHRTERLRVAWSIRRLAVSGDASSGPGNLWEACLLPDCAWQVPNNCVIFAHAGRPAALLQGVAIMMVTFCNSPLIVASYSVFRLHTERPHSA